MDECTSIHHHRNDEDDVFSPFFFTSCNSILWMFDEVSKQNRGDNEKNEEKRPENDWQEHNDLDVRKNANGWQ